MTTDYAKLKMPPRGTPPRILMLDHADEDGEPRAAVIYPGRLPVIFSNIGRAVDALRQEAR